MNSRITFAVATLGVCALLLAGCVWRQGGDAPKAPEQMTSTEFVQYLEGVDGIKHARATSNDIEITVQVDEDPAVIDQAMRDIETTYHGTELTSFPQNLLVK